MKKGRLIWIVCLGVLGNLLFYAWAEQETSVYNDHGKRDPLWPLVSPAGNVINYDKEFRATDLKLEGIIRGVGGQNLAVINGQIVKRGDLLGALTVADIKKDLVILTQGEQRFELKLNKEE